MAATCKVSAMASQATKQQAVAKPTVVKTLPQQAGRLAAAFLANVSAAKMALADELSLPELSYPDVTLPDVSSLSAGGVGDFLSEYSLIIGGGALLLAIPIGISALGKGEAGTKAVTPEQALAALAEDPRVVLVDIRSTAEIKAQGAPDLRSVKRKLVSLPYTKVVKGEATVDEAFIDKFAKLSGLTEDSLVILLDSDASLARSVAAQVLSELEVAKVYAVSGGAEAWAETAPWRMPGKGLSLSIPSLDLKGVGSSINGLAEDFKEAPTLTKAGLAAGAIAGAGVLLFNEAEVLLELAGLVAVGQFLLKLVFADERNKTIKEIKTLVDEKVAIQEVGQDLNKIASALLEDAPAEAPVEPAAEPVAAAGNGAPAEEGTNAQEAREWIESWKAKSV